MAIREVCLEFDVRGSVHLGNVYVRLKFQLDVHGFISILYSSIFLLYMFRVLFAHILSSTNCIVQPWVCVWLWYVRPVEQVLAGTLSHF
jgi:hypothetical protein